MLERTRYGGGARTPEQAGVGGCGLGGAGDRTGRHLHVRERGVVVEGVVQPLPEINLGQEQGEVTTGILLGQ